MNQLPDFIAHRGRGPWRFPENSLEAMQASWAAGVTWAECDVWASRDGVPVVIHDRTLDRTTDQTGDVAGRAWDELRSARLRDAAGNLTGAKLPALDELLSHMPVDRAMMIEIKAPDDRRLVARVIALAHTHPGRWAIQSFDDRNLLHARDLGLRPELGLLVESAETLALAMKSQWPAVRMDWRLATDEVIAELRARGKQVGVWTVNDAENIERFARLGVDQIITDEPILAMSIASRLKEEMLSHAEAQRRRGNAEIDRI